MKLKQKSDDQILKEFMNEHLPIKELFKMGFFTKEMKGDYSAMAKRVSYFFGYKTVFEYGQEEIRCHLSYCGQRPLILTDDGVKEEPFVTVTEKIF